MNVPIDDLQIGKSPEREQCRPGTLALLAPDPEQRHAMVDLGGLPQPLAGGGAAPRLQPLDHPVETARRIPQLPRHHAGGVPAGIGVGSALPEVDVPAEAVDRLPAHAAEARTEGESGLAVRRRRTAKARWQLVLATIAQAP